jgi:hypothetical protein
MDLIENRSPIYFVNLTGHITTGTSKKVTVVKVKKVVVKGTDEQIKNDESTKKRFLKDYLKTYKKVAAFDLRRLKIVNIEKLESLGYGKKI